MSITGSRIIARFWWVFPMMALLAWALILRAEKAAIASDLLAEQNAHQASIAEWDAATKTAQLLDLENMRFQEARQAEESRRIVDDYEARLADARARAAAIGVRQGAAPADHGGSGNAAVPRLPGAAAGPDAATGQTRLSAAALSGADALVATEQAIQLDALIDWVEAQAAIAAPANDGKGARDDR